MTTEQELCSNLADILKEAMGGVFVDGNFLPPQGDAAKGAEPDYPESAYVTVEPREYTAFTTRTAEFKAEVSYSGSAALDPDMAQALGRFEQATSLFEGWQRDIAAAKAAITALDVAGVRAAGGKFEPSGDDRRHRFSLSLTVRGRVN